MELAGAPVFKRSPETDQLFRVLGGLKPGERITWLTLNSRVGFDARQLKSRVFYVRDSLKRGGKAVIDVIDDGLMRLPDTEVVQEHSRRYKRKIRAASHRGSGGLVSVDYDALPASERTAHNAHQSAFGAVRLFTTEKAHEQISGGVESARVTIPPRDVLKLFNK